MLGVIYTSLGAFIVALASLTLVLGLFEQFGAGGGPRQGVSDYFTVFFTLICPGVWITQTGVGLYRARRAARFWGITLAAVLLVGLNLMLLFRTDASASGFQVFHASMIAIGIYALALLVPGRIASHMTQ